MPDRTVTIRLEVKDELSPALKSASQEARNLSGVLAKDDLSRQTAKTANGFKDIGVAAAAAGRSVSAFNRDAGKGVGMTADLEKSSRSWGVLGTAAAAASGRVRASWDAMSGGARAAAASMSSFAGKVQPAYEAAQRAAGGYEALGRAGSRVALAGVAVGAALLASTKVVADFDREMSKVAAGTQTSGAALDTLRKAALDLSNANLGFGPRDAAQAITELGKAGVKTAEITGGALKGALALAAAGQMDVAEASETAASAMTQFGKSGADVPHIADLLANGANKAQGSVKDLSMALSQAGLVANSTGLSLDETVAGLSAFASAGLMGSDAGTSFKSMLQRLTPQSAEAAKEMKRLGLNAYDSQGNFIGLANYAELLKTNLSGMTAEQRNASLGIMFGSDAIRAANVLYAQGAEGINNWTAAVGEQGAAAKTAAMLTDNLAGDFAKLRASVEVNLVQGGTGANDALRGMVQGLTGVADVIGKIPAPLVAVGSALLILSGGAMMAVPRIAAMKVALVELGVQSSMTKIALSGVGIAAGALGAAFAAASVISLVDGLTRAKVSADQLQVSMFNMGRGTGSTAEFVTLMNSKTIAFRDTVHSSAEAMKAFGDGANDMQTNLGRFLGSLGPFSGELGRFKEKLSTIDQTLTQMANNGKAKEAAAAFDDLMSSAKASGANVDELRQQFVNYIPAAAEAAEKTALNAKAALSQAAILSVTTDGTKQLTAQQIANAEAAGKAASKQGELADALGGLGSALLGARAAASQYEEALDSATEAASNNGRTLDINTEKGRGNQRALDAMAASAVKNMKAMIENGQAIGDVTAFAQRANTEFVAMAMKMGLSEGQASALAGQLGLTQAEVSRLSAAINAVPTQKNINFITNATGAISQVNSIRWALDAIQSKSITVSVFRQEYGYVAGVTGRGGGIAYAEGGPVRGPGSGTSDSIVARLSNGEYVVRAASVDMYGQDFLDRLNAGLVPLRQFATGGMVTQSYSAKPMAAPSYMSVRSGGRGGGSGMTLNVTNNYPVAEATSVTTNRALQQAAAIGMG